MVSLSRHGNKKLEDVTYALFFTKGMSFQEWDRIGMLKREIQLYQEIAPQVKRVFFFTYGNKEDMRYASLFPANVTICPQKFPMPAKLYSLLLPFLYVYELSQVDMVKTNQMSGSWTAVIAKYLYGFQLIVRCGYEWLEVMEKRKMAFWKLKLASLLESIVYKTADAVIFSNEVDKEYARKRFHLHSKKLRIIPNTVDTTRFTPLSAKKEEGRIMFVGKLEEQKNLFNLIEAVVSLPVRLMIVGDGSLRSQLEDAVKEKGAPVEFLGNIPNSQLSKELNKNELFILPSLYEGNPKALLEAMSCGLPCIGADVKGIHTIIKHKTNGYLCETSVSSIRQAIEVVMDDKSLQEKMGRGARDTVEQEFAFQHVYSSELAIYQELCRS